MAPSQQEGYQSAALSVVCECGVLCEQYIDRLRKKSLLEITTAGTVGWELIMTFQESCGGGTVGVVQGQSVRLRLLH